MFLISQNIDSYNLKLPENSVFRINLAWCNNLDELKSKLEKNKEMKFFIDLPIGRLKPPNNRYSLEEIVPIAKNFRIFIILQFLMLNLKMIYNHFWINYHQG